MALLSALTPPMWFVLALSGCALVGFVSGRIRPDLVALLVLVSLGISGILSPQEALSGFSNPAVITVWAIFILSAGLGKTGIATLVGQFMFRLAGRGERRLLVVIMLTAAFLSAFMNNVGVTALLLPVVMDLARRTGRPPSQLLIPLAFSALLGGLTTLIGTPPNLLVSAGLSRAGLPAFALFDFAAVGIPVMGSGLFFLALLGKVLLPVNGPAPPARGSDEGAHGREMTRFRLSQRLCWLRIPDPSPLDGLSLAQSHIGVILELNVLAVVHGGEHHLAPTAETILHSGDLLWVEGKMDRLSEMRWSPTWNRVPNPLTPSLLRESGLDLKVLLVGSASALAGTTLYQAGLRSRHQVHVMAVMRSGRLLKQDLSDTMLRPGDELVALGTPDGLLRAAHHLNVDLRSLDRAEQEQWLSQVQAVRLDADSDLVERSLQDSRLGDLLDVNILAILHGDGSLSLPEPQSRLTAQDALLMVEGGVGFQILAGLQGLEVLRTGIPAPEELASHGNGLAEVILSPYSVLSGQSLRDMNFREKYRLNVLAVWRAGTAHRSNLRDMPIRLGDVLLVHGEQRHLELLGEDREFLVLSTQVGPALRSERRLHALLIMAAVLTPVLLNWLPIYITAVAGAALMVLTGCLTMDEAYREIEWRAVFLIAGMLPLGLALEQTGAAQVMAAGVVETVGQWGPVGVMVGLFAATALAAQIMPTSAVAVLMTPIAIDTGAALGLSPHALLMAVAMAASASFISPMAHPANILVMGPGGYRFGDYTRIGLPLTLLISVVVWLVLPMVWPLTG